MSRRIVTIHQPDFMPWIGFFVKIIRSDIFVVLDHVKNNPRDGSWLRRVRMIVGGTPFWISIPVKRRKDQEFIRIDKMEINEGAKRVMRKNVFSVRESYSRAPFFEEYFPLLEAYFNAKTPYLKDRNMQFILSVLEKLHIGPTIYYSSEMSCRSQSTDLLIEIVRKVSGTTYLCGDGASEYQNDSLFQRNEIELVFNRYTPIEYHQKNSKSFVSGLSILDALMNVGADGVRDMLQVYTLK